MKVLWLVNIIMPEACECFDIVSSNTGGWLVGTYNGIKNSVDRLVIVTTYNDLSVKHCVIDNTEYYLVPQNTAKSQFEKIIASSEFDVIHIFGTELEHFKTMVSLCDLSKTIVSIQGLTSICVNHFLDGIPYGYCRKSKIRSFICRYLHAERPLYDLYLGFAKMAKREGDYVGNVKSFACRTRFDKAYVKQVVPNAKCFHQNETLRGSFYTDETWSFENCDNHTIFIPQAHYPIKGFHVFLEALHYVKNRFPDVKVYIAGPGLNIAPRTGLRRIKDNFTHGYFNYCKSIISKYNLYDSISFTGPLNEVQMKKQMLRANVFVLPSLMENSPNSLGEAMILGVPCAASYVGGIPDMLTDGTEGILFHSTDAHLQADAIIRIFENPELATFFSKNAKDKATRIFDRKQNADALIRIYKSIKNDYTME